MIMDCFYLALSYIFFCVCVIAGPTGMDLWKLLLTLLVVGLSDAFSGNEGEFCFPILTPSVLK